MRTPVTAGIAAAVLCALTPCGSDDSADTRNEISGAATSAGSAISGGREALGSVGDSASAQFDDTEPAAFVAAFRTG